MAGKHPKRCLQLAFSFRSMLLPVGKLAKLLVVCLAVPILLIDAFRISPLREAPTTAPGRLKLSSLSIKRKGTCLYGIRGFRAWFESQFPKALAEIPFHYKIVAGNARTPYEYFDHVLIDMNQLLHTNLRKSKSDEHALMLLITELDDICLRVATPTQSLVLAIDGSPGAAKLATQRGRRFSTVLKSERKLQQLRRWYKRCSKARAARWKRSAKGELKTLCITPGTEFMIKAEQALLYWAWQRLLNKKSPLANVQIYISPSAAAGEGEVKILDWILQKRAQGSIAILSGDSDLVLEGLIVPPQYTTHDVFVLWPDGNRKYLSVSLWETTRELAQFLPHLKPHELLPIRTDLVLLLILNGNDYLPKLRGSSGFNTVLHTYLRLLREWRGAPSNVTTSTTNAASAPGFLVHPDTLDFHLDFCIAFFRRLAQNSPADFGSSEELRTASASSSPLHQLDVFMQSGILPQTKSWNIIRDTPRDEEDDDDEYENVDDSELGDEDDVEEDQLDNLDATKSNENEFVIDGDNERVEDMMLVRLTLGDPEAEDRYEFELWYPQKASLMKAKQELAKIALKDILGIEFSTEGGEYVVDEEVFPSTATSRYSWEVRRVIEGKVDKYLGGLLWNLQTYQDGVCADYGFNYGRRLAPTSQDIADFFHQALKEGRTVGRRDLLGDEFTPPVSAGISCLAALPSQVKHLIPEPYRWIPDETVEDFYAKSMDPVDNVFDIKNFERLCENEVETLFNQTRPEIENGANETDEGAPQSHGRRIITGDHYWTVLGRSRDRLVRPFDPPPPFSDRLSRLRRNNQMRVTRMFATGKPRSRSAWKDHKDEVDGQQDTMELPADNPRKMGRRKHSSVGLDEVVHSNFSSFIAGKNSIEDIPYKTAYSRTEQAAKKKSRLQFQSLKVEVVVQPWEDDGMASATSSQGTEIEKAPKKRKIVDVEGRTKEFNIVGPPRELVLNKNGQTAVTCLKQLQEAELIGACQWDKAIPSRSKCASLDPGEYEQVSLTVRPGKDLGTSVITKEFYYEQVRDVNKMSRQLLKQHLASLALCDIAGPQQRWSELTFLEFKEYLRAKKVEATT